MTSTYPPPPWHSTGTLWLGLLRTREAVPQPPELTRLLPARRMAFMLIRYLTGTLCYDEFMVGALARHGRHAALWVHAIWVNDPQSLSGGREIWGVPKELATFNWSPDGVHISDSHNTIAAIRLGGRTPTGPRIPLLATGFGNLKGDLTYFSGRLRGPVGKATAHVTQWSTSLPALQSTTARPVLQISPFSMTVNAPSTRRCSVSSGLET
ncbi:acetoacetate decarboxylase family protein [Streptomyces sp. NPDC050085]|uniref:acetoacetate decarboxylase family protein n=1 Tax=Streptomyces sp. NPDC050085 TaxID=3365600 RepID=UPI003798AD52